jgi:hypothetical protein
LILYDFQEWPDSVRNEKALAAQSELLKATHILVLQHAGQYANERNERGKLVVVPDGEDFASAESTARGSAICTWNDAYKQIRLVIINTLDVPAPEPQADYPLGLPSIT